MVNTLRMLPYLEIGSAFGPCSSAESTILIRLTLERAQKFLKIFQILGQFSIFLGQKCFSWIRIWDSHSTPFQPTKHLFSCDPGKTRFIAVSVLRYVYPSIIMEPWNRSWGDPSRESQIGDDRKNNILLTWRIIDLIVFNYHYDPRPRSYESYEKIIIII